MKLINEYPWLTESWQQVVKLNSQQRIPHALLILGPSGLAKHRLANQIARSLLCLNPNEGFTPCNTCHSCLLLNAGNHPDHQFIEPEQAGKTIKIDQIRALQDQQTLTAKVSNAKVIIIRHADSMNNNAANSLLKLLEEPTENTLFILICEQTDALPITIISRCQQITVKTPSESQAIDWLSTHAEFTTLDEEKFRVLLKLANGAPLAVLDLGIEALQLVEQIRDDFRLLMSNQANPVQLALSWQNYDLRLVLSILRSSVQSKITNLTLTGKNDSKPVIQKYWAILDCIQQTIKLISSQNNLNKVLLIEDFMISIMQFTAELNLLSKNRKSDGS